MAIGTKAETIESIDLPASVADALRADCQAGGTVAEMQRQIAADMDAVPERPVNEAGWRDRIEKPLAFSSRMMGPILLVAGYAALGWFLFF